MSNATARLRDLITAELDRQGVTQVELAARIGRSQKHVSCTLTGASGLGLNLAERMLDALGMDLVLTIEPRETRTDPR
jgi:transcriptional regulator with XRE-family HTH domain